MRPTMRKMAAKKARHKPVHLAPTKLEQTKLFGDDDLAETRYYLSAMIKRRTKA